MDPFTDNSQIMNQPQPERAQCVRCDQTELKRCVSCQGEFCSHHLQSSYTLSRQLFGSSIVAKGVSICTVCYEEKLWLASRFAVVLFGVIGVCVGILEQEWSLLLISPTLVALGWYWSGRRLSQFDG